jgi:hypothetical protein
MPRSYKLTPAQLADDVPPKSQGCLWPARPQRAAPIETWALTARIN